MASAADSPQPVEPAAAPVTSPQEATDVDLGALTSSELAERPGPDPGPGAPSADPHPWCLLIPLGATEQHGPHLPLATDTIVAESWARESARRVPGCVVAPPLPYGSSGEHQGFPGTLSIGREALAAVLIELIRSVEGSYRLIVLVSGHGGNEPVLRPTVDQLRHEGHPVDWVTPRWPAERRVDAHAGRTETSLMLHLRPDLVRPHDDVVGNPRPLSELMDTLVTDGLRGVTESGVLGDPSGASASEGHALFDELVGTLVRRLNGPSSVVGIDHR